MARTDTLGHFLTDVADAIREKGGTSEPIQASSFDTQIANLPTSAVIPPFSETEIVVGTWVDNKPLYRKTVKYDGTINNSTETTFRLAFSTYGISGYEIMFMGTESHVIVNDNTSLSYPANYLDTVSGSKLIRTKPRNDNGGEIFMGFMGGIIALNTSVTVVINLYYTKTADTPVSDVSTIEGNNYSLNERAVSKMPNGDIVYERTLENSYNTNTTTTVVSTAHGIENIKEIWIDNGSFTYLTTATSARVWAPVNYLNHNQNKKQQSTLCRVDKTNLSYYIGQYIGYGVWKHYTTVRYTKTA